MIFIGDYFALGLVGMLGLFFFDRKYSLNQASKYFVTFLVLIACTAVTDIITGELMKLPNVPLWLNMAVNSLYFLVNLLATSAAAMYLFTKILEHMHDKHCMHNARLGLGICLGAYAVCIIVNIWTGWMFYFDEQNVYCRGPLNVIGYVLTVCQMGLVLICYFRNKQNAGSSIRRSLLMTFPIIVLCIVIQRVSPEIMLNSFIMSMVAMVLLLIFQSQRQGVHILTRLDDRHRFFESVEKHIGQKAQFQVFMISIKNYGVINQKYGHMFGDELLYQFAFSLEKLIKNSEAFHMNGTVFTLLVPYQNQYTAEMYVRTLLEFLEAGVTCMNQHIYFDYVAVEYTVRDTETDAGQFYEKLEYIASQTHQRGERFARYTPQRGEEMLRRSYLVERLQNVDREHGFEVWYQPIRCMNTGDFCSMEALVRMREPDGSYISPTEFIPLAEKLGMIAPVTWFVVGEVCRFLKDNPQLPVQCVGVNLPMAQLMDKSFIVRLNSIADGYGIEHSRIGLEFTERAILDNFQIIRSVMRQFSNEGYRFYLDDFGEGYSNFNCLLQLPFQFIKLDATLIRMDLGKEGEQSLGLTRILTDFLHGLNVQVIAEGVESLKAAEFLRDQGVDKIQGYAYAQPMAEQELLEFYAGNA